MSTTNMTEGTAMDGCDLCGDFPVHLVGRCHPTAPLRAELTEDGTLILYCYLPECGRVVARLQIETGRQ